MSHQEQNYQTECSHPTSHFLAAAYLFLFDRDPWVGSSRYVGYNADGNCDIKALGEEEHGLIRFILTQKLTRSVCKIQGGIFLRAQPQDTGR